MTLSRKASGRLQPLGGAGLSMPRRVPGAAKMSWPLRLGLLLWVLVLVGYPLVGIILAYVDLPSTALTIPYRMMIFFLAFIIIVGSLLGRQSGRVDVLATVFFLVYAFRLWYDWQFTSIPDAERALLYFLVVVFVPVVATMLSGINRFHDSTFAKLLMLGALAVMIIAVLSYLLGKGFNPWAEQGGETIRLGFKALNPISLGHVAGTALICGFYLLYETRPKGMYPRVLAWSVVVMGCFVIVLANSRGPIVATGLALAWFFLVRFKRVAYIMPLLVLIPFFMSTDNILIANMTERFSVNVGEDLSATGRLFAQELAIRAFLDYPIFGAYYIDPRLGAGSYPHNIIIETAMALGITGLIMIFAMLIRAAKKILLFYNASHPLLVLLLIQYFVGNQLSGALWGADAFFMLLTMCLTARPSSGRSHNKSVIRRDVSSLLPDGSSMHSK